MNKAIVGKDREKEYTSILNKKKNFWDNLPYKRDTTFAIHIISKKYGVVNEALVSCKADIYFAEGNVDNEYLKSKDYCLTENDANNLEIGRASCRERVCLYV